ncbi:MAG: hypothetical protein KAR79_01075 [Simkaniaceae bacterium]|nr:hypothetical protein [Simkaniaceae bacterium]
MSIINPGVGRDWGGEIGNDVGYCRDNIEPRCISGTRLLIHAASHSGIAWIFTAINPASAAYYGVSKYIFNQITDRVFGREDFDNQESESLRALRSWGRFFVVSGASFAAVNAVGVTFTIGSVLTIELIKRIAIEVLVRSYCLYVGLNNDLVCQYNLLTEAEKNRVCEIVYFIAKEKGSMLMDENNPDWGRQNVLLHGHRLKLALTFQRQCQNGAPMNEHLIHLLIRYSELSEDQKNAVHGFIYEYANSRGESTEGDDYGRFHLDNAEALEAALNRSV